MKRRQMLLYRAINSIIIANGNDNDNDGIITVINNIIIRLIYQKKL